MFVAGAGWSQARFVRPVLWSEGCLIAAWRLKADTIQPGGRTGMTTADSIPFGKVCPHEYTPVVRVPSGLGLAVTDPGRRTSVL